jgi:hypothetical protein
VSHCRGMRLQWHSGVHILEHTMARSYGNESDHSVEVPAACASWVGCKLASARSVDLPVLDLEKGREQFVGRVAEKAVAVVEGHGADVIVLDCTGLAGLAEQVKAGLLGRGYNVPVIDPAATALKVAEALVDAQLTHSKQSYPHPPEKVIGGYNGQHIPPCRGRLSFVMGVAGTSLRCSTNN